MGKRLTSIGCKLKGVSSADAYFTLMISGVVNVLRQRNFCNIFFLHSVSFVAVLRKHFILLSSDVYFRLRFSQCKRLKVYLR